MTATLALLVGALATYVLRVSFIALVPADRLPARVRLALDDVGPAAMAAIVATHLAHRSGPAGLWSPSLVAAFVAALVAWRTRSLGATVLVGIGAMAVLQAL